MEPSYNPDRSEPLGGHVYFGEDEKYEFPCELEGEKVEKILERDQDAETRGIRFPGFRVQEDGVAYDLLHLQEESIDAIGVYDTENGEVLDFYDLEEISEVER